MNQGSFSPQRERRCSRPSDVGPTCGEPRGLVCSALTLRQPWQRAASIADSSRLIPLLPTGSRRVSTLIDTYTDSLVCREGTRLPIRNSDSIEERGRSQLSRMRSIDARHRGPRPRVHGLEPWLLANIRRALGVEGFTEWRRGDGVDTTTGGFVRRSALCQSRSAQSAIGHGPPHESVRVDRPGHLGQSTSNDDRRLDTSGLSVTRTLPRPLPHHRPLRHRRLGG